MVIVYAMPCISLIEPPPPLYTIQFCKCSWYHLWRIGNTQSSFTKKRFCWSSCNKTLADRIKATKKTTTLSSKLSLKTRCVDYFLFFINISQFKGYSLTKMKQCSYISLYISPLSCLTEKHDLVIRIIKYMDIMQTI